MLIGKAECLSYADSNNAVKRSLLWKCSLGGKKSFCFECVNFPTEHTGSLSWAYCSYKVNRAGTARQGKFSLLCSGCSAKGLVVQRCSLVQLRQSLACFFLFVLFSAELLKMDFLRVWNMSATARTSILFPCSSGLVTWTGAVGCVGRSKQRFL